MKEICDRCHESIKNCKCKKAQSIWSNYLNGNLASEITTESSAPNELVATSNDGSFIIVHSEEELIKYTVENVINTNIPLKITQSTHKSNLNYAKNHLVDKILRCPYPSLPDKENVILHAGVALNKQIDKNDLAHFTFDDPIIDKLKAVNKRAKCKYKSRLEEDFEILNFYYNATKHDRKDENKMYEQYLSSDEGKNITIHFFETVRLLFLWYYENFSETGKPDWDELKEIDYKSCYGAEYEYSTYKLNKL